MYDGQIGFCLLTFKDFICRDRLSDCCRRTAQFRSGPRPKSSLSVPDDRYQRRPPCKNCPKTKVKLIVLIRKIQVLSHSSLPSLSVQCQTRQSYTNRSKDDCSSIHCGTPLQIFFRNVENVTEMSTGWNVQKFTQGGDRDQFHAWLLIWSLILHVLIPIWRISTQIYVQHRLSLFLKVFIRAFQALEKIYLPVLMLVRIILDGVRTIKRTWKQTISSKPTVLIAFSKLKTVLCLILYSSATTSF